MFCDMVGSSALSTRLDPEEQRDVVSAFQTCCANEIKCLEGMVAQYLGDGVLAYFGYPAAHEDDAERSVRAGLAILDVVGTLQAAPGVTLQARIGIASGVVVVGDLGREGVTQENAAIGLNDGRAGQFGRPEGIVFRYVPRQAGFGIAVLQPLEPRHQLLGDLVKARLQFERFIEFVDLPAERIVGRE
jgi:hypothetical protein